MIGIIVGFGVFALIANAEAVTVDINPNNVNLNVNDDAAQSLASVSVSDPTSICSAAGTVSGLITFTGSSISKLACSDTSCGSCSSCSSCLTTNGCFPDLTTYSVTVTCSNGTISSSDTLTITVSKESPTLVINLPASVSATNSMSSGTVIATASQSSGPPIVQYVKQTSVVNSYSLGTVNLFDLNTANGEVYINSDPSLEYYYDYRMEVCIQSRRQDSCDNITINFDGCFQTPNCRPQTINTFSDQHAIGDTLFTMNVSNPSGHFTAISPTWQNLSFAITSTSLGVATIDPITGVISTTGNVTVWPDYPYSTHTIVVTVTNPGHSCSYSAQCTMSMQFSFTNWPISFVNLPNQRDIHEDTDSTVVLINIITFDYNNPLHDNVTCDVVRNENDTLLSLTHDGNHEYNSYSIEKLSCQNPGCGFICYAHGCLNYDLDDEFEIEIICRDAYGSNATALFTMNVTENQPPVWTNVPTTTTLNSDDVSFGDVLFSIYYSDAENEILSYNYTITPDPPKTLFGYDSSGNYHDNPANITALAHFWDQTNSSYLQEFCGTERRNMVCSSLTIDVREYCGPTPSCDNGSTVVSDQTPAGSYLLTIDLVAAPAGLSYTDVTYGIVSSTSGLFSVDPITGIVTTAATLSVNNPPAAQTYVLTANVYDTAACGYGSCPLSITVTFTNFDISITNMGSVNLSLHEDTETAVTLLTIATSDANTVDDVSCSLDSNNSVPTDSDIFSVKETDTSSNVFQIISKENPGFDYGVRRSYTIAVICSDNYGSQDDASITLHILENQAPTIDNLNTGDIIVVDPTAYFSGDTIFTLQTSDVEGDSLNFNCSVENSYVPLHCVTDGVVSLRRNVQAEENGNVYNITLCIAEIVHSRSLCETLGVNFTSSKTNPVLDNLPASVSIAENAVVGTNVFNVTVDDPDVGDVHIFSMEAYPSGTQFSFNRNNGELTLQSGLDYETVNSYSFVFSVRDAYLQGLDEKVLTVNITDVNEQPTLNLGQTTFTTHEENVGYQVATVPYNCTDPDNGQNMTLSITAGSYASYFSLDSSANLIFSQNWDFETDSLPLTTTLELTCDDGNGLNDVANIAINIDPKNEFAPVLNTIAENITIYSNQTLVDSLLTITATDNDYGHNGVFDFRIIGGGQGVNNFIVRSSGDNSAEVFIRDYFNSYYNHTFVFTVEVSDGETDAQSASVFITVTYIAPELPTPQKSPKRCLLCTNAGVTAVSILCAEGFVFLVLFFHASKRMKIWRIFRLKPKQRRSDDEDNRRRRRKVTRNDVESYQPDSETLFCAVPNEKPPPKSIYQPPQKFPNEPPPAPEYIPPQSTISLQKVPDLTEPREDWPNRKIVVTPTNVTFFHGGDDFNVNSNVGLVPKNRKRRHPSRVTNPHDPPIDPSNLLYNPLEDPGVSKHPKPNNFEMNPMFRRPIDSLLNSDYYQHQRGMDF